MTRAHSFHLITLAIGTLAASVLTGLMMQAPLDQMNVLGIVAGTLVTCALMARFARLLEETAL